MSRVKLSNVSWGFAWYDMYVGFFLSRYHAFYVVVLGFYIRVDFTVRPKAKPRGGPCGDITPLPAWPACGVRSFNPADELSPEVIANIKRMRFEPNEVGDYDLTRPGADETFYLPGAAIKVDTFAGTIDKADPHGIAYLEHEAVKCHDCGRNTFCTDKHTCPQYEAQS